MSSAIVDQLTQVSTCDLADALLKLKVPYGGYIDGIKMWSPKFMEGPTRIAGPAYTVKYVKLNHTTAPKPPHHYIDGVPEGAVVFVSAPPNITNCVYGGLMSNRAKLSGAVATVVDGKIRDLQEHRNLEYPVFAQGVGTTAPYETVRVSEIGVPLHLQRANQEVTINPGDYIVGDLNGVILIPKDIVEKVIELVIEITEDDEKALNDIKAGMGFAEATKKHRRH